MEQTILMHKKSKTEAVAKTQNWAWTWTFKMAPIQNENFHHPEYKRQRSDPFFNKTNEEKNP